jgi:alpha/beta superfamily hydrolase
VNPNRGRSGVFAETVSFASGELRLEGVLRYPAEGPCDRAVLLFSPHPQLGGDMDNNVVKGIASYLSTVGYAALSFNYRCVGGSGGCPEGGSCYDYWSALDEGRDYRDVVTDGLAALEYLRSAVGVRALYMAGYSFGARILEEVAAAGAPEGIAAVSLPVRFHDFSTLAGLPGKKLLVWGDGDFTGSEAEVQAFAETVAPPRRVVVVKGQDHFFRGYERELAQLIGDAFGSD